MTTTVGIGLPTATLIEYGGSPNGQIDSLYTRWQQPGLTYASVVAMYRNADESEIGDRFFSLANSTGTFGSGRTLTVAIYMSSGRGTYAFSKRIGFDIPPGRGVLVSAAGIYFLDTGLAPSPLFGSGIRINEPCAKLQINGNWDGTLSGGGCELIYMERKRA